jgi:quercetin dioxygenase-like cupin family protein
MTDASRTGSFGALEATEPYAGLHRRTFDMAGATVNEYRFDAGAKFPLHTHPEEQLTVVTEGTVELTAGDEVSQLTAGDFAVTAGGVAHGIHATSGPAAILAIVVPRRTAAITVVGEEQ